MATDTSIINGTASESISPQIESFSALFFGLSIGFYYCWQQAVVCLILSPLLAIGRTWIEKIRYQMSEDQNNQVQDADLLCGDVLTNYKTI